MFNTNIFKHESVLFVAKMEEYVCYKEVWYSHGSFTLKWLTVAPSGWEVVSRNKIESASKG